MDKVFTSEFKLGIIAGGQLGKMLVLAASNWDIQSYVMDKDPLCPASSCCSGFSKGDPLSYEDIITFGASLDMLTYELENINVEALKELRKRGVKIVPDPDVLEIIQDKGMQKEFFRKNSIPSSEFGFFENRSAILKAIESGTIRLPFVQKLRKGGYDGRGVQLIKTEADLGKLLDGSSLIEEMVNIASEISVLAARNEAGEVRCFPVVEMDFNAEANLVERLICPSSLDEQTTEIAVSLAKKLINGLKMSGLLAVEMFLDKSGKIWVNEVAPRPHNSGHHTIESTISSQFEQLLRAIFNLPLGSTQLKIPAVMVNLLGEPGYEGPVRYEGLSEVMGIEGVKIHLYGKQITKPFRKMGHITVLSNSIEDAIQKAEIVKQKLKVIS